MRLQYLLGGFLLAATALPAAASGGLDCSIKDKSVQFTLNSGVTHGMGGPTFNLKAELKILRKGIVEDFRTVALDDGNRPQYWLDGKDLRLLFYREREGNGPFASVELEIRTKATGDDEGTYNGTYKLTGDGLLGTDSVQSERLELKGKVSCSVE